MSTKKHIALASLQFFSLFAFSQSTDSVERSKHKLRSLSPDRPHQTESPITVDRGHVMIEADLVNFMQQAINDSVQKTSCGIFFFNVKVGFHKRMDMEVLSGSFLSSHYTHSHIPDEKLYFPDLLFRYKFNLFGNDSGSTALAIMPTISTSNFFKSPFQVNGGQLLLNAEKDFGEKIGFGYTGGLSAFQFQPLFTNCEWYSTVSFDYKLGGAFRHFLEVSDRYSKVNAAKNIYSFDSGITFTPASDWQLDLGFYYFLPEKNPFLFIGGSIRI